MGKMATLETIGQWDKQMEIPIENALMASIDMMGLSGRDACERAMVFMSQSAAALTPRAPKNRKVHKDEHGRYFEYYKDDGTTARRYEWHYKSPHKEKRRLRKPNLIAAKAIGNRGLAKRSWQWCLKGIKAAQSKPIQGVGSLREIISESVSGFIAENKLSYITQIMPAGWQETVHQKATNRIMATAAKIAEKRFAIEIPRLAASRAKRRKTTLAQSFRKAGR